MRELVDRKQRHGETIDAYFHVMCRLRTRHLQPISELDMIKILKSNVREGIRVNIYQLLVFSVEQLRWECIEAERNFPRRENRTIPTNTHPPRHLNEIYRLESDTENSEPDDRDNVIEQLAAINVSSQAQRTSLICWNCHHPGHMFMTPKCPICQSGNRNRNGVVTGDYHPSEASVIPRK